MHPIAERFSEQARRVVVELFSDPANVTDEWCGLAVKYRGARRCPLGVALAVDDYADLHFPPSGLVAYHLDPTFDNSKPSLSDVYNESIDFIGHHIRSREKIVDAFTEPAKGFGPVTDLEVLRDYAAKIFDFTPILTVLRGNGSFYLYSVNTHEELYSVVRQSNSNRLETWDYNGHNCTWRDLESVKRSLRRIRAQYA